MSRIVQITKSLTIMDSNATKPVEEDEDEEDAPVQQNQGLNFEVEEGIYQAGDLVEIFQRILMRMNTSVNDSSGSGRSEAHVFPLNDLHESSKYRSTVDWEHLASKED